MLEKRTDQRFQSWDEVDKELLAIQQKSVGSAGTAAEDPLATVAAQQLEVARIRTLSHEKAEREKLARHRDRQDLISYWAGEYFGIIRRRIAALNEAVKEIHVEESPYALPALPNDRRSLSAEFLYSRLTMDLEVVPVDGPEELLAWGTIEVTTNRRLWLSNIALTVKPEPYGTWWLVEMEVNPIVGVEPADNEGGSYEVRGSVVMARNWVALARQRRMKGVMSAVVYRERTLPLDAVLDDCFRTFIEDASVEPDPSRPNRG
jgi:hypothetical protein